MNENLAVQPEIDNPEDDVRRAIEELKIETPPEARVVVDKSSAQPERIRDDDGKFAKEPKGERKVLTLPEKPAAAAAPANEQAAADLITPAPTQAAIKAPDSWKPDLRAKFNELPPDVQAEVLRREKETVTALTKQDDERTFGRRVNEIVSPYLPTIRAEGGTPEKAIQDLLQTAHELRNPSEMHRARTVARAMEAFKVSPQALISILQGSSVVPGQPQQPGSQLNLIIESLEQRFNRMERERQEEIQQRQLQQDADIQRQVEEFQAQPGHEHFERVREYMGKLLQNGMATGFQDAYDQAVYADPEIRSSLISAANNADQSKRITELNTSAARARQAAGSVTGGPGGAKLNGSSNPNSSIEDDLRAAMREHSGRV